jgi:hypothetical protein
MSKGFFTIERLSSVTPGATAQWITVCHLSGDKSVSDAMQQIETSGKPGFFRVIQTVRMVWAEVNNGKMKQRRWHASSPETLQRTAEAFERDGGIWPVERAKKELAASKHKKK